MPYGLIVDIISTYAFVRNLLGCRATDVSRGKIEAVSNPSTILENMDFSSRELEVAR